MGTGRAGRVLSAAREQNVAVSGIAAHHSGNAGEQQPQAAHHPTHPIWTHPILKEDSIMSRTASCLAPLRTPRRSMAELMQSLWRCMVFRHVMEMPS